MFVPFKYDVGKTKTDFQRYLDGVGCPEHDKHENGGRYKPTSRTRYGQWLRRTDPIQFDVEYNIWKENDNGINT